MAEKVIISKQGNLKAYLALNCAALPQDVIAAATPVLEKFTKGKQVATVHEMGLNISFFRGKVGTVVECKPSRIHPYVWVEVSYGEQIYLFHPGELEVKV